MCVRLKPIRQQKEILQVVRKVTVQVNALPCDVRQLQVYSEQKQGFAQIMPLSLTLPLSQGLVCRQPHQFRVYGYRFFVIILRVMELICGHGLEMRVQAQRPHIPHVIEFDCIRLAPISLVRCHTGLNLFHRTMFLNLILALLSS